MSAPSTFNTATALRPTGELHSRALRIVDRVMPELAMGGYASNRPICEGERQAAWRAIDRVKDRKRLYNQVKAQLAAKSFARLSDSEIEGDDR
jgi:hypothetical protein